VPLLATLLIVILTLAAINGLLRRRWRDDPDAQFRFQLIMLLLTLAGIVAVIVALPVADSLRGQLLSLLGIILSAAIALSSTTFIGNIMAGIMLKVVKSAKPGDFITVDNLTGRITEMDLLHTEIQTEFRNLVTVPNLYLVTRPTEVVRASGTIISAEVSLGFDVPRGDVAKALTSAATQAGLADPFVHVRELGDYSVVYRIAGLLEEVQSLISARSRLRECMLDALHEAGIEIVSPNFMNTRALAPTARIVPDLSTPAGVDTLTQVSAEDIAFDKAAEAASVEELKKAVEQLDAELAALEAEDPSDPIKESLLKRKELLAERFRQARERQKAADEQC
ncbi:MAG: mechanosensitive ion channel, partial [Gammaproteobacteria bacterium]|nr:mechanosensitive ion channel [Gammaproteobacteria bacterium]